jgi:23S rRNA (uridine2552-2'-O)-methyltransferase
MSPPKRSKSSRQWLDEHFRDDFVQRAQKEHYRSRAAYKLLEIQDKDHLLKPGMTVVDLGAAPGGWSQVAVEKVGSRGKVIALDILPMDPIAGVTFIQGDFTEQGVLEKLLKEVGESEIRLVLSDMAPNISGVKSVDQPRAMYLAELAFDLAQNVLSKDGDFLVKVFQGEGFDHFLKQLRLHFTKVVSRKPRASRPRSREIYLLAKGFLG